jgi:hypothetical protein
MTTLPDRLPKPDFYDNYWLGADHKVCPVVLCSLLVANDHRWFASKGGTEGVVFDGMRIRYFPTPELALEALRESA